MNVPTVWIPSAMGDFSKPYRFRLWRGGRGGGKSATVARVLISLGYTRKIRVLCCREFLNSISESQLVELREAINVLGLSAFYTIQRDRIVGLNGTEFIFKGLSRNETAIKSLGYINYVWVEEAETISRASLEYLIPTIRAEGSELWFTWNPARRDAPIEQLREELEGDPGALIAFINWIDNRFFPAELEKERLRCLKNRPDDYAHIWEGDYKVISNALVFRNRVEYECEFEAPVDARFYYGVDWGFAQDPTEIVRCFILNDILHIDYSAGGVGIEFDNIPDLLDQVPGSRDWPIKADGARPETISYLANRYSYKISAAAKWAGSVEDGIERLKSFAGIRIHKRAQRAAREFMRYSYKVDRLTGDVLPRLEDRNNHTVDAVRYALDGLIQNRRSLPDFKAYAGQPIIRKSFI